MQVKLQISHQVLAHKHVRDARTGHSVAEALGPNLGCLEAHGQVFCALRLGLSQVPGHLVAGGSWALGEWWFAIGSVLGTAGQARGLFALSHHWSIWQQTATQPGATRIAPASGWCPFHPQEHPSSPWTVLSENSTGNNPVNLVFTDRFIALEKICKESGFLSGVQKAALRGHVRDEQREPTWLKLKKKE